jgi:hypothetical protein
LRTPTVNPADHIPEEIVETCRGRASLLATNPDYPPYAAEYLNDRETPRAVTSVGGVWLRPDPFARTVIAPSKAAAPSGAG